MKALQHVGNGVVKVVDTPEPVLLDPSDAIVRVQRAAVCGTDLHLLAHPDSVPPGTVLGHEFVGEIVDVGPAVRAHSLDDLVVGADFTACGSCWWCRRGDHWECHERRFFGTGSSFGPPLPGAQAELIRVPFADTVLRSVPDGISADAAVFLGDTLATGYAAVQRAEIRPGDTVAVIGAGPVGQLASLAAQACSAGAVAVVEPVAERRDLASREGAITAEPEGARRLVDELTDGRGADAVIDAIGGAAGLQTAFAMVRRRGTIVSVGVHSDPTWPLPADHAFAAELTLRFTIGDFMRDAEQLTALLRAGVIDPCVVASELVPLAEAPDAYARMASRETLKSLIAI